MKDKNDIFVNFVREEIIKKNNFISQRKLAKIFKTSHSQIKRLLIKNNLYEAYSNIKNLHSIDTFNFSEIDYYKHRYKEISRRVNNLNHKHNTLYNIIDAIVNSISRQNNVEYFSGLQSDDTEDIGMLCLSDIHVGKEKEISSKYINIVNSFIKKSKNRSLCYVVLCGDIVDGIIHDELLWDSCLIEQIIQSVVLLESIFNQLLANFKKIEIFCVYGNHGRILQKKYFKREYNNFDYLIYKILEKIYSNNQNIMFNIAQKYYLKKQIFNKNYMFLHGDCGRGYMLHTKIKNLQNYIANIHEKIDYIIIGHYHNLNVFSIFKTRVFVCPTIAKIDDFEMKNLYHHKMEIMSLKIDNVGNVTGLDIFDQEVINDS